MISFVAFFGLAAWVYLLFLHPSFQRGFWRADQKLPPRIAASNEWPSVTAIVPARNEAETIGDVVAALTGQQYPGRLRIIVVDDASSDATAEIARGAGKNTGKIEVLTAPTLQRGWTGKLWALDTGVLRAEAQDQPDLLWFTDADVVHPPETLARLVSKMIGDSRDLVSLMVRLRCESFWEQRLVPAFIFFFQMLYPFPATNDDFRGTAAAAGGCVLLRRTVLGNIGGLAAIRSRIIDDCALAAAVKRAGGRLWIGLAGRDESRSLRSAEALEPYGSWCAARPSPSCTTLSCCSWAPCWSRAGISGPSLRDRDLPLAWPDVLNLSGNIGDFRDDMGLSSDPDGLWKEAMGGGVIAGNCSSLWRHDLRFGHCPFPPPGRALERQKLWAFIHFR